jgi:hypothetical protein
MSIFGAIIMWIWLAVVYVIWSKWPIGDESNRRHDYWEKYEQ